MSYQFTPAAQRVLSAAARWTATEGDTLEPVHLLLGLTSEPEYRAGRLLASQLIDVDAIRRRWPEVACRATAADMSPAPLSIAAENALQAAMTQLDENPRKCEVATEHLLLGLALSENEVGRWMREAGLDPTAMEAEICRRYGIDHTPIAIDLDEPAIPLAEVPEVNEPAVRSSSGVPAVPAGPTASRRSTVRILDAAANRAGEALRVVEDYVRFALDDRSLTEQCKSMRHELTAALLALPLWERLAARDTPHDVGTTLSTDAEMRRGNLADVAAANVRRLQESLRSLEEFAKLVDIELARRCEQLRYRSYTLQQHLLGASPAACVFAPQGWQVPEPQAKGVVKSCDRRAALQRAKVYVLMDARPSESEFTKLAEQLVAAGVDIVQLRDKTLDDRTLLARAQTLRSITRGTPTLFIMNDRPDLAALSDADGVHVGQEELSVADARRIVGPERLVGVSTHSIEQARQAARDGTDYIGVGPTFPSGTKQFANFPGLELIRAVAAEIELPAFAIGGITPDKVEQVRQVGLQRIAVSGAIANAPDVATVIETLRHRLDGNSFREH